MRRWVLVAWLGACGPVAYVSQTTMQAQTAVDAARDAGADKYSPYWWTRAVVYLHMAREVAAHADYQGANHFGRLSSEAAEKAAEEADLAAKDPTKRPVNPTNELAPAKDKDQDSAPPAPAKDGAMAPAKE